jgi:DNA-directed RNA polymerase
MRNATIARDSTASFMQHWTYHLRPINKGALEVLNLSGPVLHDFYMHSIEIIRRDFSNKPDISPHQIKIFDLIVTRKTIKKSIMTSPYKVSYPKSLEYFRDEVMGLEISDLDLNDSLEDLSLIHKSVYDYAANGMFKKLFILDRDEFLSKLDYKTSYYPTYMKTPEKRVEISFIYYQIGDIAIRRITNKGEDVRIHTRRLTNKPDLATTERALNANFLHSQDARLSDHISYSVRSFQIHDSFACSIFDVHLLMDSVDDYFNQTLLLSERGCGRVISPKQDYALFGVI